MATGWERPTRPWRALTRCPRDGARSLGRRGEQEASRIRSKNGCVEATRGLCSTMPVQPSATGTAPEGRELAHAKTAVARHVPRARNRRARRPCAHRSPPRRGRREGNGRGWRARVGGRKAMRLFPDGTSLSAGGGRTDGRGAHLRGGGRGARGLREGVRGRGTRQGGRTVTRGRGRRRGRRRRHCRGVM